MRTEYKFFSSKIPDNDASYFSLLEGVIEAADPYADMCITHAPEIYHFRIIPSTAILIDSLIKDIMSLNNLIGIQMEMSKSMKSTGSLNFKISLKNQS